MTSRHQDLNERRITRRGFVLAFAGAVGVAAVTACAPAATPSPTTAPATAPTTGAAPAPTTAPAVSTSAKIDKIVVGAWGGAWGDAIHGSVGSRFEKEMGVKVEYARGGDTERKAKMRAEKGNQTLDVAYWTPTSAAVIAKEIDAVLPLREKAALIPNLNDLHKGMSEPEIWTEWTVAPWMMGCTLLYRTDQISKEDAAKVDSWRVIFDPKYKGKIGWPNINYGSGWGFLTLAMLEGQGTVESGKPHEVDKAWDLVKQLKPQVATFYKGDDEAGTLLKSGETWITLRFTFETYAFQKDGVPVDQWTKLKEGMIANNEGVSIVRNGNSAREDLAAKWVNMQLSAEAQSVLASHMFTPVNKKAEIPAQFKDKVLTVEEIQGLNHFDWIWMGTQLDKWMEEWNRTIAS